MERFTKKYSKVDWSKTNADIAGVLGVSPQTISDARRRRGLKDPVGHGGGRKGAGRKPKPKKEKRARVSFTLGEEAIGQVAELSKKWKCSRSLAVERAVNGAAATG
jgi:hypothetical protein